MQQFSLPSILSPDTVDLSDVNQKLKAQTLQLDWSAVDSASQDVLQLLLAGLSLEDSEDVLGAETMSEAIATQVANALLPLDDPNQPSESEVVKPEATQQPALWSQGSFLETRLVPNTKGDNDSATSSTTSSGQGSLITTEYVVSTPSPTEPDSEASTVPTTTAVDTTPSSSPTAQAGSSPYRVLQPQSAYDLRAELEKKVLADLLGPAGGQHEELSEARVSDRYLVGLVAPLYRRQKADEVSKLLPNASPDENSLK